MIFVSAFKHLLSIAGADSLEFEIFYLAFDFFFPQKNKLNIWVFEKLGKVDSTLHTPRWTKFVWNI